MPLCNKVLLSDLHCSKHLHLASAGFKYANHRRPGFPHSPRRVAFRVSGGNTEVRTTKPERDSDTHNARSQVQVASISPPRRAANNKALSSSWHRARSAPERRQRERERERERGELFRPLSLRLVTNTLVLRSSSPARSLAAWGPG